jgi:predicted nucleotidyltransferase
MEEIKDRLGDYKYNFFKKLQNYLDTELIFYGSIKRSDYFENSSDVDVTIITDNVKSLLTKVHQYLQVDKNKTQKIFQQHSVKHKGIITGYKIKYENPKENIYFDLLIYDETFRNDIMQNINDINNLPLYMVIILYILKVLHYTLYLIPNSMYLYLKSCIFFSYFNKELKYYKKEFSPVIMVENYD